MGDADEVVMDLLRRARVIAEAAFAAPAEQTVMAVFDRLCVERDLRVEAPADDVLDGDDWPRVVH